MLGPAFVILAAGLCTLHAVAAGLATERVEPLQPLVGRVVPAGMPFRFAVMGDNRENMAVFERVVDAAIRSGAEFILHTGDLVEHHNARQFRWVLHELQEVQNLPPFCAVPGNHDVDASARDQDERYRLYTQAFGPRRYWFAWGRALFVALDNSSGRVQREDLLWLERILTEKRPGYDACFVVMHMPPRDPRPRRSHAMEEGEEELMDLLGRHKVSAVFAGHIHSYLQDQVAGVPIYITGGAGAGLQGPGDSYHYLLCTVGSGGQLQVERRNLPGCVDYDYPEYVLRVKLSAPGAFLGSMVLLVAGLAMGLVALRGVSTRWVSGCANTRWGDAQKGDPGVTPGWPLPPRRL